MNNASSIALRHLLWRNWEIYRLVRRVREQASPPYYESRRDKTHRNYHVIDTEPLIIVTSEGIQDMTIMSEVIGQRPAQFLLLFWSSKETAARARETRRHYLMHKQQFPAHKITFACNTTAEYRLFREIDLPAILCNHNSLLDERIYRVCTDVEKRFDVVYNGRLELSKRHFLLRKCESVALISGIVTPLSSKQREYMELLKKTIPGAVVLNVGLDARFSEMPVENYPHLVPEQISPLVSLAQVGAILSIEEGACYASAEYLLTGLPVVSTQSFGGRDMFFDSDYVEVVAASSKSVYRAIQRLIRRRIPANEIRQRTLSRMQSHRERFQHWLQTAYRTEGVDVNVESLWSEIYVNKMIKYAQPFPDQFAVDIYQLSSRG